MTLLGTRIRYGAVAQVLHWVTAILVIAAWLVAGTWRGGHPEREVLHETLGMAVFVLVIVRLAWRQFDRHPTPVAMPSALALASRASHWLLYALLFFVPATAIAGSWLEGHAVTVYGLGAIGPFLAASRQTGHAILQVHQLLGTTMIWVAGLHAAAAIFHHLILRDRVLRQMLPVG